MERAYGFLEYMKGMMDALKTLENCDLASVPPDFENRLSLASSEFNKGHYKKCIRICNRAIPEIKKYAREKGSCLKGEK